MTIRVPDNVIEAQPIVVELLPAKRNKPIPGQSKMKLKLRSDLSFMQTDFNLSRLFYVGNVGMP